DPASRLAFDLQHPTWDGIEGRLAAAGAVRVDDLEREAPFRYLRLREPPYSDDDLRALAETVAAICEPAYAHFRPEDEPTARLEPLSAPTRYSSRTGAPRRPALAIARTVGATVSRTLICGAPTASETAATAVLQPEKAPRAPTSPATHTTLGSDGSRAAPK